MNDETNDVEELEEVNEAAEPEVAEEEALEPAPDGGRVQKLTYYP